jgi:phosphocarrier protein
VQRDIEIVNKLGLHARAAAKLVKLASSFESDIAIEKEGRRESAKSIMGVMMLAASCGTIITVHTNGSDEEAAMNAIAELINDRFEENQ